MEPNFGRKVREKSLVVIHESLYVMYERFTLFATASKVCR